MNEDESQFHREADALLARLADLLDAECGDEAEVEQQGGVLTLKWDKGGTYVINKHEPTRQIWLSSPVSGASHFESDPASGGWRSTREPRQLLSEVLDHEISARIGRPFDYR